MALAGAAVDQHLDREPGDRRRRRTLPGFLLIRSSGGEFTKLSKDQAEYIDVDVEGPYKSDHYRY